MRTEKIAIFGGTFNPPHMGHITAARACVEALSLDRLLMIPTNIPPHKTLPEGSASPRQRLEMTAIAASMIPMAEASPIEIERAEVSYTVDTVAQIKRLYPQCRLWLVVGTDMLGSFENWRGPAEIAALCRLAAVARSPGDRDFIAQWAKRLKESVGACVDIVSNPIIEGSSTDFRRGAAQRLVPPEVRRYIRKNRLYGDVYAGV